MPGIPTTRWFDAVTMPGEREKSDADGQAYVAGSARLEVV